MQHISANDLSIFRLPACGLQKMQPLAFAPELDPGLCLRERRTRNFRRAR